VSPCRWLEKAAAAGPGTARQAHIVRHVRDMWLWSLRRGVGTPCRPMVVTYVCRDDGHVCGGLGDRVKGQNLAFWQVRHGLELACALRLRRMTAPRRPASDSMP